MDGILPLWKPKGLTSHDCVFKIRKLLHTKKVGHTGTLDPGVEGVLPICVGEATKIVQFLTDTTKTYIAEVALGTATDTEDAEGVVIAEKTVKKGPTTANLTHILQQSFTGVITQIPPMYSAVKVNGKKLYEYARAGQTVVRPERHITIHEISLLEHTINNRFKIKVVCSKGTYIRTLCVDIGKKLGYPAHMHNLVRTKTGMIHEKDTITFSELEQAISEKKASSTLLPIATGLTHLDKVTIDSEMLWRVQNGQKLPLINGVKTNPFVFMHGGEVIAVYQKHPEKTEQIKPVRVFHPANQV